MGAIACGQPASLGEGLNKSELVESQGQGLLVPENSYLRSGGCQTDKGRISLSRVMSNGCGDESARKMYNRATVAGSAALGTRPVVFEPLLNC